MHIDTEIAVDRIDTYIHTLDDVSIALDNCIVILLWESSPDKVWRLHTIVYFWK